MVSASLCRWFAALMLVATALGATALGGTAWGAGAQPPKPDPATETLARANALRREGSFRLARELYEKLLAPATPASPETRTQARVWALDCLWRERAGGEAIEKSQKELGRLIEDLPADSRWRAEAAESLGDLQTELGRWHPERQEAQEAYLVAIEHWGKAPDPDAARPRYVALNFKLAEAALRYHGGPIPYPATPIVQRLAILPPPPPPDKPWEGDLVSWALRNVLRVSQAPVERAHALYLLGNERLNFRPSLPEPPQPLAATPEERERIRQWDREAEDYLKQAAAIQPKNPWTDKALWDLAQYYQGHEKYVEAARTLERLLAQFNKSETPFHDQARQTLEEITRPSASLMGMGEIFAPDSHLRLPLRYRNIDRATLRLFKLTADAWIESFRIEDPLARMRVLGGEKVREQAVEGIADEKKHIPHDKTLFLDPLPPGIYLAEIDAPGEATPAHPRRAVFRVSRLALAARTVKDQEQVFVADAESGKPLANARIRALYGRRQPNQPTQWEERQGHTDASGVARFSSPAPTVPNPQFFGGQTFYFAEHKGHFAATQSHGIWPMMEAPNRQPEQFVIYLTTDRPAYRPGEPIQWKAILRTTDGKTYKLPSLSRVYVMMRDGRGQPVHEGDFPLSEYGSIHGSFTLDRKAALGMLSALVYDTKGGRPLGGGALARLEEYKLPEYKVTVEPPAQQTRFGAALAFNIGAEYYFGGPVAGAEVEVVVHRGAFWPHWMPPRPFPWFYEGEESVGRMQWMPWIWPRMEPERVVLTRKLKTDAQGKARIETAPLGAEEIKQARDRGIWGYEYRVEARVVDSSRREVRESGSIKTARTAFAAYLNPQCYLYLPGDPVKLDLKTLDPNERPVSAEGFVTMFRRVWNDKRLNAKGDPEPGYDDTRLLARPARTDKEGAATVEFAPDEPGFYLFRFETKDQFGEEVKAETVVFVAKQDTHHVGFRSGGVTIITDKDTYAPGETAHVLLTVRRPGAAVWFGVEGEAVHDLKVVQLEGTVKMLDVPVTADFQPNIYFTAASMFDYAAFQDSRRIVVPPKEQFLDVKLTAPKATFKPGEKATVEVEVKDSTDKPVRTELSLGVADAAVWAIQGDLAGDIRQAFWSRMRGLHFSLSSSAQEYTQRWRPKKDKPGEYELFGGGDMDEVKFVGVNRRFAGEYAMGDSFGRLGGTRGVMPMAAPMAAAAPMMEDGVAFGFARKGVGALAQQDAAAELAPARLRTDFSSTALWLPTLITDAAGRARVEITFPDSLTTWKLTAHAADKATRVGEVRQEVKTSKPVLVRPQGPRFFTQGDAVTLSAVVNNNTSQPLTVEVALDLTGLKLASFEPQAVAGASLPEADSSEPVPANASPIRIRVPAQGQRRVDWRALAEAPGTATIRTTARSAVDSDAVERSFPVREYGIEQFLAAGAVIKGLPPTIEKKLILNLPAQRRPGSESLVVQIEPTLARTMVGALEYLAQYPYGCTEQTVSRFVPAVTVARVLRQLHLSNPVLAERLPDMIRAGLDRLADFQHDDGGWGWWKEGPSDLYMTAYAIQGLGQAVAAGVAVPREMLARGEHFLAVNLIKAAEQPDLTAFILYALASVRGPSAPPAPVQVAYNRLWPQREKLNPCSRALFTLACHHTGRGPWAETLARNLRNGLIQDAANGTAHWGRSGIFHRWSDGAVEGTAFSLRALIRVEPESKLIDQAMTWLARNRRGARWENTRDTAIAIRALADYVTFIREDTPDWTAEVEVNGQRVATLRAEPGKAFEFEGRIEVPADRLRAGENTIVIRRKGVGSLYASAWLTYFTRQEKIEPAGNEVFAQRRFFRTRQAPTLSGTYQTLREEVKPGTALKSGDRIQVELKLEAKNDYEYIVIEDLKAAGMEPTEVQSGYDWGGGLGTHRELRDEKTAFFIIRLPEGKHTITYELRAEVPGMFHALPALVHAMYVPEIRANSGGARVEIRD